MEKMTLSQIASYLKTITEKANLTVSKEVIENAAELLKTEIEPVIEQVFNKKVIFADAEDYLELETFLTALLHNPESPIITALFTNSQNCPIVDDESRSFFKALKSNFKLFANYAEEGDIDFGLDNLVSLCEVTEFARDCDKDYARISDEIAIAFETDIFNQGAEGLKNHVLSNSLHCYILGAQITQIINFN